MNGQVIQQLKLRSNWIVMILMVMVIFICSCSIQAAGKEKDRRREQDQYYAAMEKEYRNALKEFLNRAGYSNSGINMTKVVTCNDGVTEKETETWEREYTVCIYNKKINRLEVTEVSELMTAIVNIDVPMTDCVISHKFIKTEE